MSESIEIKKQHETIKFLNEELPQQKQLIKP